MAERSGGYTILEVMIFLAVSALIFVSAAVAVGGRQRAVQYSQSVRDFENQVQDVANDVGDGYYPSSEGVSCTVSGANTSARPRVTNSGSAGEQGSNDNCVAVGKALLFNIDGNPEAMDFGVTTLVGVRQPLLNSKVTAKAMNPVLAYNDTPGQEADLSESKSLRFGLRVTGIYDAAVNATSYSSFVVAAGFNSLASQRNGRSDVVLYAVPGSVGQSKANYRSSLDALADAVIPPRGVVICLRSAIDENKRAQLFVGENGTPTNVRSELDVTSGVCA